MIRCSPPADLYLADGPTPQEVSEALRRGVADDRAFDRFLPEPLRAVSRHWWTPLAIAALASRWLDDHGIRSILDIGAGTGKFCVAAALTGGVRCVGLEHRARLVSAARDLARIFAVEERVSFIHGALGQVPLPAVDAYYLYNPFGENLFGDSLRLDRSVELSADRFSRDTDAVERLLDRAPPGFCLVTYNGFGGRVPRTFEKVRVERRDHTPLCLWRKVDVAASGSGQRAPRKSRIALMNVSGCGGQPGTNSDGPTDSRNPRSTPAPPS